MPDLYDYADMMDVLDSLAADADVDGPGEPCYTPSDYPDDE